LTIEPTQVVPSFVRRLLRIGTLPPALKSHFECGPEKIWFQEQGTLQLNHHIIREGVDCILFATRPGEPSQLTGFLLQTQMILDPAGRISLLLKGTDRSPWDEAVWDQMLSHCQLMRYHAGVLNGGLADEPLWAVTLVQRNYNPVLHARLLVNAGRPDCAIAVIDEIPPEQITGGAHLTCLSVEKQNHYFQWQIMRQGQDPPHALFSKERREFAQVTAIDPLVPESYRIHASFWSYLGRTDMAARVLRSIERMCPDDQNKHFLSELEHGTGSKPCLPTPAPPAPAMWNDQRPAPRILIITHDHSDYGLDILYHGLCNILGKQNVIEYPWKPTLHGLNRASAAGYPCVFDYPGGPIPAEELATQLRQGRFDLIVYADVVQMTHCEAVRRLMSAAPHVPVVLYDTWDDCYTPLGKVLGYIGREKFDLIFKREMLAGVAYGDNTHPLPFGYPESLAATGSPKTERFFWAGKKEYGLRPLYIPYLEQVARCCLDRRYEQTVYRSKLSSSRIGLSFFGCGFDTVRYWELPANGVMLLAERPPILIPFNFVDGVSAAFFDDLPDLAAKLAYYLERPDETARIAAAGHAHFLRHHTATARARQFLGRVAAEVGWRCSL